MCVCVYNHLKFSWTDSSNVYIFARVTRSIYGRSNVRQIPPSFTETIYFYLSLVYKAFVQIPIQFVLCCVSLAVYKLRKLHTLEPFFFLFPYHFLGIVHIQEYYSVVLKKHRAEWEVKSPQEVQLHPPLPPHNHDYEIKGQPTEKKIPQKYRQPISTNEIFFFKSSRFFTRFPADYFVDGSITTIQTRIPSRSQRIMYGFFSFRSRSTRTRTARATTRDTH